MIYGNIVSQNEDGIGREGIRHSTMQSKWRCINVQTHSRKILITCLLDHLSILSFRIMSSSMPCINACTRLWTCIHLYEIMYVCIHVYLPSLTFWQPDLSFPRTILWKTPLI